MFKNKLSTTQVVSLLKRSGKGGRLSKSAKDRIWRRILTSIRAVASRTQNGQRGSMSDRLAWQNIILQIVTLLVLVGWWLLMSPGLDI